MCFLQRLSHQSVDFVCVQETHVSSCTEADSWFSSYAFLAVSSPGTVHSCGSVILYRLTFTFTKSHIDRHGHFVLAHLRKMILCLESYAFMHLIATPIETIFSTIVLIRLISLSPLSYVVILMLSLTEHLIARVLALTPQERVLSNLRISFTPSLSPTHGVLYTRTL